MPEITQVFEYGQLRVGDDLKQTEFERLVVCNDRHGGRYFQPGHQKIHFNHYVGVIQVGRKTIEILPKIDDASDNDKSTWHGVLIQMLRRCGFLNLDSLTESRLRIERGSLFDLYLESFLAESACLIHQGLTKKYRQCTANLGVLKGQLQFAENLRHNQVHREHFYTRHQTYDRDNIHNQVLKNAMRILSGVRFHPGIMGEAKRLLLEMDAVSDVPVNENTFKQLCFDRGTERYRRAILLAKLIILNYSPDIRGGRNDVLVILFDMNALFERYIFCELRRASPPGLPGSWTGQQTALEQ
jgi:5-methylcytosine-specific restriction enzyme subunit McrC